MGVLNMLRQSAFSSDDLMLCLPLVGKDDVIVLIDDGCYNLAHPLLSDFIKANTRNDKSINIMVLKSHAKARAISVPCSIEEIDMKTLVNLTTTLDKVITWQ